MILFSLIFPKRCKKLFKYPYLYMIKTVQPHIPFFMTDRPTFLTGILRTGLYCLTAMLFFWLFPLFCRKRVLKLLTIIFLNNIFISSAQGDAHGFWGLLALFFHRSLLAGLKGSRRGWDREDRWPQWGSGLLSDCLCWRSVFFRYVRAGRLRQRRCVWRYMYRQSP